MDIFIKRLQMLLDENNMNQKELAHKVGVTEVTISRYMNGERKPRVEIINKIAEALNTTTDYLLGRSDIRNPYKEEDEKLSDLDKFLLELKKKAIERGIEFNEDSVDDLLDLYEFIKSRNKKSN